MDLSKTTTIVGVIVAIYFGFMCFLLDLKPFEFISIFHATIYLLVTYVISTMFLAYSKYRSSNNFTIFGFQRKYTYSGERQFQFRDYPDMLGFAYICVVFLWPVSPLIYIVGVVIKTVFNAIVSALKFEATFTDRLASLFKLLDKKD